MTKKLFPIAALLIPMSTMAAGTTKPPIDLQVDAYALGMSDYCFPSGLRIIFQEDHSQPIVNFTQVIDRGSDADPIGLEGIAHVLEHLWFRSFEEGQIKVWDQLAELGAQINAFTADDVTAYLTIAPVASMDEVMELEVRRIMGEYSMNNVTQEEVNLEREIARNELRMRYENTGTSGLYYLMGKLFPEGHPYARLGIGTHDSLDNITIDDVNAFAAKNYVPSNATMLIIGDFDLKDSWDYIARHFPLELLVDPENPDAELELADCPVRIDVNETPPAPPDPVDLTTSYHKAGVEKPTILIGWSLPAGYREGHADMAIAGYNLNLAVNQFLNPDWDPATDAYEELDTAGCWVQPEEHATIAMCGIEVGSGLEPEEVLEDALDGLYLQWETNYRVMWGDYFSKLSKYAGMASVFRSVETVASLFSERGVGAAMFTHFTADPAYFSRSIEALDQVDFERISAFAFEYINRNRAVSVILEPYEEGDILIDSSDQQYKGRPYEGVVETRLDLTAIDAELLREATLLPDLATMREFQLDNGLQVVIYPYGDSPLVRAELRFKGGQLYEPIQGLADFSMEYTSSYLPGAGNTPLRMGGEWLTSAYPDWVDLGIVGSSANLEGLLWMVRERADQYSDPGEIKVEYKKEYYDSWIKSIRYSRKFPEYWQGVVMAERTLGKDHPLVDSVDEFEVDAMRSLTKSDAKAYNQTIFRPDNAVLFLVGRMDADKAEEQVRNYFGGWINPGEPHFEHGELPAPPEPPARQIIVLDKQLVSQTSVAMECLVRPQSEDGPTLDGVHDVLGMVLSEMAWDALRERSGVSYGAYSYTYTLAGGTTGLYSAVLVQNDSAGVAAQTFMDQAARVQSGDFPQDLIPLMKVTAARNTVLGQQTHSQMTSRLQDAYQEGGAGWDELAGYPDRLAAVTLEDLQAELASCIGHEVVTLLGPVEVVTPQLDELGLTYEVFDWETERLRLWEAHDPKGYAKAMKKKAKEEAKAAKKAGKEG